MRRLYYLLTFFYCTVFVLTKVFGQAPTNGLVAYYPFNGNANDASGNGNHGTVNGTPTYPNRVIGSSIRLDAFGIQIPQIITNSTTSFSISIWVKEEGLTNNDGEGYIFFGDHSNSGWLGILHGDAERTIEKIYFAVNGGANIAITPPANYKNNWVNYQMVYNNGILKAFVNGVIVGQINSAIIQIGHNNSGIGTHWFSNGWDNTTRFIGSVDDIRIYNRVLTDSEVQLIYQSEVQATCPTCLTAQTVANYSTQEHFCAAQGLCTQSIIQKTQTDPKQPINRGDLAKIAYLGLLGKTVITTAVDFPVPFVDLQAAFATDTTYYKYAKVLSYLEYADNRAPFDRNQLNFNPTGVITRALVLKVLLEAWNIDESTATGASPFSDVAVSHLYYKYIKKAHELGIVTGSGGAFSPDDNCKREDAFLMLYRLLSSSGIPKPTLTQVNVGFFIPGQYRPDNMGVGVGTDRGNFNHYTKTSFAIDGVVPLVFAHSYNSYTTELPNQLYPNYLGRGWTHSFNCYITVIGTSPNLKLVVHYPDGKLHFYKTQGGVFVPETIGVFDQVTTSGNPINSVTITTPSKVVYLFEQIAGQTNNAFWLIKSIKDRNNNTLTFTNEIGISGVPRLASVADPSGRTMNFTYLTGQNYNYLSQVTLAGVGAFNGRNIQFTYHTAVLDGDGIRDLATYKEYDLTGALKTTSYSYYTTEGAEHLLKTITLPKGNVIDNTYEKRKLKSSQTLNGATVVQQMSTNWTQTYNSTAATSTGAVTVTGGGITKTTNYTHNGNGLAQTLKSTGTNQMDLTMTYGVSADPTSVSQITQMAGNVATNVTIAYHPTAPYNVSSVTTVGPNGNITQSYTYTPFNDIYEFTNGRGNKTTFGYNATGNLTSITHPLGQPTTMLRNSNGTISKVTTPAGVVTNFTYNIYGNLLTTSTPNGASPAIATSATYDALSRVTSKTDARNQTVSYDYFANDLLKKMNAPLGYFVEYNYDANDNNTTVTNAKNNATTNVYHPQTDQLMSRSFGSKTESFTYYEDGSLKTFTNGRNQTFTFTYDPSGRVTSDSYATYTYNPEGTLNTVTHTQGAKTYTLDYDYDVLRRLTKTTCDGFAVQYRYDNNNNLDLLTYPDGKTVAYTYDDKDRITKVTDWAGKVTTYVYDDDGKVLSYTLPNGTKALYTYDAAGRPTGIRHEKSNGSVICAYTFTLDQGGNHTEENIIEPYNALPVLAPTTTNYTTNTRNETTAAGSNAYVFDGNGATTTQVGQAINWDSKDNLLTRNGITYFYDGNETRRAKTGKRYVINELSNSVLAETDEVGTYFSYYVYGPTGLLYRPYASPGTAYYHYDFRGSTIALTDDGQNIFRQYQYDAYGKILQQTSAGSDDNPFRYVGQHGVQYEAPDLYFMRARYYDPTTGKFLSEDPIWSTNVYNYGSNDPINKFDPDGRWPSFVMGGNDFDPNNKYDTHYMLTKVALSLNPKCSFDIYHLGLGSDFADTFQGENDAYIHAMRAPNQTCLEAVNASNSYIRQGIEGYLISNDVQIGTMSLGTAIHTIQDYYSPQHGFKEWHSEDGPEHVARELVDSTVDINNLTAASVAIYNFLNVVSVAKNKYSQDSGRVLKIISDFNYFNPDTICSCPAK